MTNPATPYVLATSRQYCNFCPGYCCYRLPGSRLLIDAEDINRLACHFNLTDGEVRHRFLEGRNTFRTRSDGSCIFLANDRLCKRCTVHLARPKQCREFPYERPCPYLDNPGLLELIQPRIEQALLHPGQVLTQDAEKKLQDPAKIGDGERRID